MSSRVCSMAYDVAVVPVGVQAGHRQRSVEAKAGGKGMMGVYGGRNLSVVLHGALSLW